MYLEVSLQMYKPVFVIKYKTAFRDACLGMLECEQG